MQYTDEVAIRDQPPFLENTAIMGPTHSPVLDAMTTLEERERIEADYEWFRYSKFALPFIFLNGVVATVLICLCFWWGGTDFTDMRQGTPRQIEFPHSVDDAESGLPTNNRNLRVACFSIGTFGLLGIILTMYIKPAPTLRKVCYFFFAFVGLFICGILGAIAGGMDAGKVSQATWCRGRERGTVPNSPPSCYDMSKMLVALTVIDLSLAGSAILTALVLVVAAAKSFATPTDEEYANPNAKRGVSRTTREALLFLLFVCFILLLLMFIFTIIIHEGRDIRFSDETFYVRSFNNYKPGWPLKNTRLRISACAVAIGMSLFNLVPFRSRVWAYVCAFVYWIASCLLLVCFALDVKAVDTARKMLCPYGWQCTFAPFITTCVFDLWVAIQLILYIIFEFIARLLLECRHCTRNYGMFEIKKHECETCPQRPVRCEVCAKRLTAKEFVYKHRFECGHDTKRCEQCGTLVAEWSIQKHKEDCPKWPVQCTMCETAFAREDLPAHTAACPMTPASCEACGETVRSSEMSSHLSSCNERQVACSNCGLQMPMYKFESHSQACH
jgi:hypothetical protein